jgi:hypothetical protein
MTEMTITDHDGGIHMLIVDPLDSPPAVVPGKASLHTAWALERQFSPDLQNTTGSYRCVGTIPAEATDLV